MLERDNFTPAEKFPDWQKYLEILSNYQIKNAQLERQKKENLSPSPTSSLSSPKSPFSRFSRFFKTQKLSPSEISLETSSLEIEQKQKQNQESFYTQIFSHFSLAICHLYVNRQNNLSSLIEMYLNSHSFTKDQELFCEFLHSCLSIFGEERAAIMEKIKSTNPQTQDRESQRILTRIIPKIFSKVQIDPRIAPNLDLFCHQVTQLYYQHLEKNHHNLPQKIFEELQKYARNKIYQCLGLNFPQNHSQNLDSQRVKKHSLPLSSSPSFPETPTKETPICYQIFLVLTSNTPPIPLEKISNDDLEKILKKQRLTNLSPTDLRQIINNLAKLSPIELCQKYKEKVAFGSFDNWHKIRIGSTGRLIFLIKNYQSSPALFIHFGSHEKVYGSPKKVP